MRRALVSGGAGYVGRVLTRLLAQGSDVCVADLMMFGEDRFRPAERGRFRLERVDIRDKGAITELIRDFQPEVIIHLAALHYIPDCENRFLEAHAVNVTGTLNLLAACPAACRFVLASSGAVYSPSDSLHHESASKLGPMDVYGFTKLHAEHYTGYFAARRGFPAVIVRLFNVIGPGETTPHLLPELIAQLKAGRSEVELGNLTTRRDFIDVRDAASGFAAAALSGDLRQGEVAIVNLGTSRQHSAAEIIERLRTISGIDFTVRRDPTRVRALDRPFLGADIRRIRRQFGWAPKFSLEETLTEMWRNPDLSRDLQLSPEAASLTAAE
jgi:UDP-glucose 4-epimerase